MDEAVGVFLTKVQPAFNRSHPEAATWLGKHGVHGVWGEGMGIAGMNGVAQQQTLGSETGYTARLGAYPDVSLIDADAIHEIAS